MTLAEIRATYPHLFYSHGRPDEWFRDEPFMQREAAGIAGDLLAVSAPLASPFYAADLALAYVERPELAIWRLFLWTADLDSFGNPVYVGGLGKNGCAGFQIHRKLDPQAFWVVSA